VIRTKFNPPVVQSSVASWAQKNHKKRVLVIGMVFFKPPSLSANFTGGRLGYLASCRRSPRLAVGGVSVWMVLPIPGRSGSIQRYSLCGSPALSVVLTNSVDVIFSVPRHVMLRAVLALVQVAVSHSRVTIKLR
jgi:hypothetical protein